MAATTPPPLMDFPEDKLNRWFTAFLETLPPEDRMPIEGPHPRWARWVRWYGTFGARSEARRQMWLQYLEARRAEGNKVPDPASYDYDDSDLGEGNMFDSYMPRSGPSEYQ